MTRQVVFLPTEINAKQRMLKRKLDLLQLQEGSSDIYLSTRFDEYLHCPEDLKDMTHPEFSSGGVKAVVMKIKRVRHNQRGMSLIYGLEPHMMILQFLLAQQTKKDAINQLALALHLVRDQMVDGVHVMTLCRCMR